MGASPAAAAQASVAADAVSGPQTIKDRKVLTGIISMLRTGIPA
jgi:hypothetical protein